MLACLHFKEIVFETQTLSDKEAVPNCEHTYKWKPYNPHFNVHVAKCTPTQTQTQEESAELTPES